MVVNLRHKYNPPHAKPEMNDGSTLVEMAGYIPAQKQIENMISAGLRLSQARKDLYDFEGENIDESYSDPTRDPNFDMADASRMAEDLTIRRRKAQAEILRKAKAAEANAAAQPAKSEPAGDNK